MSGSHFPELALLAARKGWGVVADFKNVLGGWTIRLQGQSKRNSDRLETFIADRRNQVEALSTVRNRAESDARAFLAKEPDGEAW
jgi:hypothetical protein